MNQQQDDIESNTDSRFEQISKELDYISNILSQKDEGESDLLKRIEALEREVKILKMSIDIQFDRGQIIMKGV